MDRPLSAGGILARLMATDLDDEASVADFFRYFRPANGRRPSLKQLEEAQAIGRALDAAIMSGDNAENWKIVRTANAAIDVPKGAARRSVVASVAELLAEHERDKAYLAGLERDGAALPDDAARVEARSLEHAGRTLESLANLDSRFATVSAADLMALVRNPLLGATGIAAKLSLRCGAFDDGPTPRKEARTSLRNVKRKYEQAADEVPR